MPGIGHYYIRVRAKSTFSATATLLFERFIKVKSALMRALSLSLSNFLFHKLLPIPFPVAESLFNARFSFSRAILHHLSGNYLTF